MSSMMPERWGPFIRAKIQSGRDATEGEVLDEALDLLKQSVEAEEARAREGIRSGLEDLRAGRTQPLGAAFEDIHRALNLPPNSGKSTAEAAGDHPTSERPQIPGRI